MVLPRRKLSMFPFPLSAWLKRFTQRPPVQKARRRSRRRPASLTLEVLEDRTVPTAVLTGVPTWLSQGPAPELNGDSSLLPAQNNQVSGALESIAVNPANTAQIVVGTVNGGVWRTTNADPAHPTAISWTPLTDQLGSLAIGAVAFDPADPTGNTFYAGTGLFTNSFDTGGAAVGLYKTTDAGAHWTLLGQTLPDGTNVLSTHRIKALVVSGSTILVGTINGMGIGHSGRPGDPSRDYRILGGGLFASTDGGATFTPVGGNTPADLPAGAVTSLVLDPNNAQTVFAGIPGQGVFRSNQFGAGGSWTPVNSGLSTAATLAGASDIELTDQDIGGVTTLFAGVSTGTTVNGVFTSSDGGTSWTALASPPAGLDAGGGFAENFQLQADPSHAGVVYLDGQAATGIFRYDPAGAGSWVQINGGGTANNTSPHTDSRDLKFLGNNTLLESDDGGIYALNNPTNAAANDWNSFNGNLDDFEFYSVAYDPVNQVIAGGTQDNGSPYQSAPGSTTFYDLTGGDGQATQIDSTSSSGKVFVYSMLNNLKFLVRTQFNNANVAQSQALVTLRSAPAAADLSGLNAADQAYPLTTVSQTFALNRVNPQQLMLGFFGLYEDTNPGGAHLAGDVVADISGDVPSLGGTITDASASNGGPIVIESAKHGLRNGEQVTVFGVAGNTNANGRFSIKVVDTDHFSLDGSQGNGNYMGGGSWSLRVSALAYGGNRGGNPFANVAVVGTRGGGRLYFRGETGSAFTEVDGSGPGQLGGGQAIVQQIALDPADWRKVYVLKNDQLWFTANITDLANNPFRVIGNGPNDNLGRLTNQFRSITVVGSTPVLGAAGGVYRLTTSPTAAALVWAGFGQGMPNVVPRGLSYNAAQDLLVAGTMGRGVWSLANASTVVTGTGVLTITNDNTVDLRLDPNNPQLLDVFENQGKGTGTAAVPDHIFPLAAVQQINVTTTGANAELFLDFGRGNFLTGTGINYNGGTGPNNGLNLFGPPDPFANETATPTGPNSGTIVFDAQPAITYSNVTFVDDTVPITGNATINGAGVNETINVIDGGTVNGFHALQVNGAGTPQFATFSVANKPTLTVQDGGVDTFNLNTPSAAAGLNTLLVRSTSGDGTVFNAQATAAGVTTNLLGGNGSDVFVVSSDAGVDSPPVGTVGGITGTLGVVGGSGPANRLIVGNITGTGNGTVLVTANEIAGLGGAATLSYATAAGGGFTDGAANDGILILGSSLGGDTFNVQSTLAGSTTKILAYGSDSFVVSSDAGVNNPPAGNLLGIAGILTVVGGPGVSNRLIVSNVGGAASPNVLITDGLIHGFGGAADIFYSTGAGGNFSDGAANDGILIRGSALGSDTFNVQSTLGGSTTEIQGNGSADSFNVSSDAGVNNPPAGDLRGIAGVLAVVGGSGPSNRLVVSNFAGLPSSSAVITASVIHAFDSAADIFYSVAPGGSFTDGTVNDGILIRGSSAGGDTFDVQSTLAGSTTKVVGYGRADTFVVSSDAGVNSPPAGTVGGIAGVLTLLGGQGFGNRLIVSNVGGSPSGNAVLTPGVIRGFGGAADIFYAAAAGGTFTHDRLGDGILIRGSGAGGETFTVLNTLAGSSTTLQGYGGGDVVNVRATSGPLTVATRGGPRTNVITVGSKAPAFGGVVDLIQGGLTVIGAGADTLIVDDTGSTRRKKGYLTATTLTGLGMGAPGITFSGLAALQIHLGPGGSLH
jgi:hypothetical protein